MEDKHIIVDVQRDDWTEVSGLAMTIWSEHHCNGMQQRVLL